jgi:GWxTD domain-containing protein
MLQRLLLAAGLAVAASGLAAQSIPELFGKAKEQIKADSWADALKTLDALDAEANKPGQEAVKKQLEGPLAFYRGVCDANLGKSDEAAAQFGAFLKAQPNASIDSAVYSKKAVAAFEKAQKAAAADPDRAPSFANNYKAFQPAPGAAEVVDEFWANGAVRWIMTDAEKKAWAGLKDGNARTDFVEKFWEARRSLPDIDGRTFRAEFERRAAFADANLALDAEQKGSLTDRGMVFVLLGPPTYAARKPLRTGEDASISDGLSTVGSQDAKNAQRRGSASMSSTSAKQATTAAGFAGPGKTALDSSNNTVETWVYRKERLPANVLYQQVDFKFLTKQGYGANVLQRESDTITVLEAAKPRVPAS